MSHKMLKWVKRWEKTIKEAGDALAKRTQAMQAADWALAQLGTLQAGLETAQAYLMKTLNIFSDSATYTVADLHPARRYRTLVKMALGAAIGAAGLDLVIATSLANAFFWYLSPAWAYATAIGTSVFLALLAHGGLVLATGAVDAAERPVRVLRILRSSFVVTFVADGIALIIFIIVRTLSVPDWIVSTSIGLLGVTLPVTVAAALNTRTFLNDLFVKPLKEIDDLKASISTLKASESRWRTFADTPMQQTQIPKAI
jgi:hypothetical protein